MSLKAGDRIHFDLDSDFTEQIESYIEAKSNPPVPALNTGFVGDIKERESANPPPPPTFKATPTGFPTHKKRTLRTSAFRQQRAAKATEISSSVVPQAKVTPPPSNNPSVVTKDERQQIDEENRKRIAAMSPAEIERERQELFEGLSPGLIQRLLSRATLDDGSNEHDWSTDLESSNEKEEPAQKPKSSTKTVTFAEDVEEARPKNITTDASAPEGWSDKSNIFTEPDLRTSAVEQDPPLPPEAASKTPPDGAHLVETPGTIHFPAPPQPPELDPDSPSFLSDLHEKYFPNLPYDPSALAWMRPVDPKDTTSPYHPSQQALAPAELRFDFKGRLLTPSVAREIPATEGLHHHEEAPEAAGYTVPELARLARSAVPAQRCIAYQTLGRILYRLGQGQFGEEAGRQEVDGPAKLAQDPNQVDDEEDVIVDAESFGSEMATGLWNLIEHGKVIETLTEEAKRERGHLTARTYAQEALWNWRRGGGRRRKAV